MITYKELHKLNKHERANLLKRVEDDLSPYIDKVRPLIEAVKEKGDEAIYHYTKQIDDIDLSKHSLQASDDDFKQAWQELDHELIDVLKYAGDNIRRFHEAQMPAKDWMMEIRPGVHVGERHHALSSVACYSPRGKGSFPSVTLMTLIPAVVAGVRDISLFTPPGPDGKIDAATLVAAQIAGIDKVYRVGGALCVAAAAFGTNSIQPAQKIIGPGSPYFMAAKSLLRDIIDPGLPAGPSEVIIFADDTANKDLAALDVIIESEHGSDSSAYLLTTNKALAQYALNKIPEFWQEISQERAGYSRDVLSGQMGGVVYAKTPQMAYDFINDYAPEHLQILSNEPQQHLPHIYNASEVLMGHHAPGALANYMMGPNCVLPTNGSAKIHSPLGVHDFLKRSSLGQVTKAGFDELAPKTELFARYEGFDAHALSVSKRRKDFL